MEQFPSSSSSSRNSRAPASGTMHPGMCMLDGYNVREDPRYRNLCSNRRKTTCFQSFAPFQEEEDKVYQQLSKLLEYDFQRRTPLRRGTSIEDFAKAFSDPSCMFR